MKKIAIVGAGFSGAVIARELAITGYDVEVFDSRDHVAGNCHTKRDPKTNIMMHVYGPHIFHTSNLKVWNYIRQYDEFMPFVNRVKANFEGQIYPLPINLLTINSLFRKALRPQEAKEFVYWQGHDFSMRGLDSIDAVVSSGLGHLTSFYGTDSLPAIYGARKFYGAEGFVGGSVPATEHSVMCAGGKEDEIDTFRRLLETYPKGILSVIFAKSEEELFRLVRSVSINPGAIAFVNIFK